MTDELRDDREPGWYHVDNVVLDAYGRLIGVNGIAVYSLLARRANKQGVSWPSYNAMAATLGISRPTAIATIRKLEQHGLIRIQTVKEDGKRPFNRYTLVKVDDQPIGKDTIPVKDVDQSVLVKEIDRSKTDTTIGKRALPEMVKEIDPNNTQLTRPKEQDPSREVASLPARARATRIPDDFAITQEMRVYAAAKGVSATDAEALTEEFVLYWQSTTKNPLAVNWVKRWQVRVLEQIKAGRIGVKSRDRPAPNGQTPVTFAQQRSRNTAEAFRRAEEMARWETDSAVPNISAGDGTPGCRIPSRTGSGEPRGLLGPPEKAR